MHKHLNIKHISMFFLPKFQGIFSGAAEFNIKSCRGDCWKTIRLGRGKLEEDPDYHNDDHDVDMMMILTIMMIR